MTFPLRARATGFAASLVVASLFAGSSATPAWAHAVLLASNPPASAAVMVAPVQVQLTFDDDLLALGEGNQILVTDPLGNRVDKGTSVLAGATLTARLAKLNRFGRYQVSYHVISADGHPVTASYFFYWVKKPSKKSAKK